MQVLRVLAVCVTSIACSLDAAAGVGPGRSTGSDQKPMPAATEVVGYYVSPGYPGSGYRDGDEKLAEWAFDAWAKASAGGLRFTRAEQPKARIRLYWAGSRSGFYGEARPDMVDGGQGAAVLVRPSLRGLGPRIEELSEEDRLFRDTVIYLTCLHEIGHALGLPHTADERDIMDWFGYGGDIPGFFLRYREQLNDRSDFPGISGLSERDVQRLRTRYPPVAR